MERERDRQENDCEEGGGPHCRRGRRLFDDLPIYYSNKSHHNFFYFNFHGDMRPSTKPFALPSFVMPLQERAPTPSPDSTVSRALHVDADAQEERFREAKKEELQSVAPRDDLKSILWNTRMSSKSGLTPGLGMGATRPTGSAHPTAIDEFYYFASLDPDSFYQLHRANPRRNTCRYQVQRLSSCFVANDR